MTLIHKLIHIWAIDLVTSLVNYLAYSAVLTPMIGGLPAHQVGMTIRVFYTFAFAYLLFRGVESYRFWDLVVVGLTWMSLWLAFEWGGSLLVGRPVSEILVGWNLSAGYMWLIVLASYPTSCLAVGLILRSRKASTAEEG